MGSAQRRRRGAVLQHGSILLGRSHFAPEVAGIEEAAGVTIRGGQIADRWPPHLAGRLGIRLFPGILSEDVRGRAMELVQTRFAMVEHLERR